MSIAEMRKILHHLIDEADEKKIKGMYLLLEDEITSDFKLSDEQLNFLNEERAAYLRSEGTSHSWQEAKNIIKR